MQTTKKKPTASFVIRLDRPDLRPWDIPSRALTRIVNAVQRLIEHAEPDAGDLEDGGEEPAGRAASPIQLLDVISASAAYSFAALDDIEAIKTLTDAGKNLNDPAAADWEPSGLYSIRDISAAAKALGCSVEIRRNAKDGEVLARITPESYDEAAKSAFFTGESSVYGYLERVGGAVKPHCGLRVAAQPEKMIICHLASEDLARDLGPYVYKNVHVSGKVTWFRKTRRIKTIVVNAFDPPKEGSILKALDRIHAAGGKAWDDVDDVDSTIAEIRGK